MVLYSETWPKDGDSSFGYPPMEMERKAMKMPWRGVRFGSVSSELYYEKDGYQRQIPKERGLHVCAETGEGFDTREEGLFSNAPSESSWETQSNIQVYYNSVLAEAAPHFLQYVQKGLSNAVPIGKLTYEQFHSPFADSCKKHDPTTLTIAVSYTHKLQKPDGLLKANEYQVSQLKQILEVLRDNPPPNIKYVRLWTDQALSMNRRAAAANGTGESASRTRWNLYGLLPYGVFTVALLLPEDRTDAMSMWSSCEQILADGGCGCVFSTLPGNGYGGPPLCKDRTTGPGSDSGVRMTVGDGLSIHNNLRRLSAAVHAGILDETVTFHIADAQLLVKLAYFISRTSKSAEVPLSHGLECEACLSVTLREGDGYYHALMSSTDKYSRTVDNGTQKRVNEMETSLPFPKVRARRGFACWNGIREFLPGAGRFAKMAGKHELLKQIQKHLYVLKLKHKEDLTVSHKSRVVVAMWPSHDDDDNIEMLVIAIYVHGCFLDDKNPYIFYSMRLNITDLEKLVLKICEGKSADANEPEPFLLGSVFRHPVHRSILEDLVCEELYSLSSQNWTNLDWTAEDL